MGVLVLRDRAAKVAGAGLHREFTSEATYERVRSSFRRIGLTRIANITGLDRIGIPVYNAVMPRSNDFISIYSGKGTRPADARTSAVMEAIERHVASRPMRVEMVASHDDLLAIGQSAMAPRTHSIAVDPRYRDSQPVYWVAGWDLLNEEEILVPQSAVAYGSAGGPPCYMLFSSNGLASGNTLEEAVCHALCEVIERDALTLAEVVSGQLGYLVRRVRARGTSAETMVHRLWRLHPHLDPISLPAPARELAIRFLEADVPLRLMSLTSDIGVPTVLAASREDNGPTASQTHGGFGTDPDISVAAARAISECAQARAVDISATREDLELPGTDVPAHRARHRRSAVVDDAGWIWSTRLERHDPSELASDPSDDVVADIRLMLGRLRSRGIDRVIVVDLSPPDIPVHVVRVLVPGLESWGSDRSKMGRRATQAWNTAVRMLGAHEPASEPGDE